MDRITREEAAEYEARLRTEGYVDVPFDDAFEHGTLGLVNIGLKRARNRVVGIAKNRLGQPIKSRSFRFSGDSGGVVVVALKDKADDIIAQYGEGWNS